MWKIIISVACLVAATAGTASIEDFLGEWAPLAVYPNVNPDTQTCLILSFAKGSGNLQCTDGRKFEVVDTRILNETGVMSVGVLPVDDVSIVTPSFKVTCTNEDKNVDVLLVAKSINKDYALLYRLDSKQSILSEKKSPSIWVYGRNVPTRAELMTFVNSRDELRGKTLGIFCTSD